jgi:hypothetical protein
VGKKIGIWSNIVAIPVGVKNPTRDPKYIENLAPYFRGPIEPSA